MYLKAERSHFALLSVLFVFVLFPLTANAAQTIWVTPPNGKDDTSSIQQALNQCVSLGPGCTVQLRAGTYHIRQVIAHNFQGTLKGMGKNATTIEALFLPVNWPDPVIQACNPNFTDCLWATLITFIDGNVNLSDLTVNVSLVPATALYVQAGTTYEMVYAPLEFTGHNSMNVTIDRIAVNGMPDSNNEWGVNIENGIHYSGELARSTTPGDYYFLSGSYTVRNSSFNTTGVAISEDGFVTSSRITIGGSPDAGNFTVNDSSGIDLEASEKSIFDVSYNITSGIGAAAWVVPYFWPYAPSGPSQYLIHDNQFTGIGSEADVLYLQDVPGSQWISAAIYNNTIVAKNIGYGGIDVQNTTGTTVMNNKILGDGAFGVGIFDDTYAVVLENNVTSFVADPDLAQIVLDGTLVFNIPDTSDSTVFCRTHNDTVLDLGTNDQVIACKGVSGADAHALKVHSGSKERRKRPARDINP